MNCKNEALSQKYELHISLSYKCLTVNAAKFIGIVLEFFFSVNRQMLCVVELVFSPKCSFK